jgi:hypothetical protein
VEKLVDLMWAACAELTPAGRISLWSNGSVSV